MALRDQPYIPLYVQDFMTDEKLIECSASATGVYIRIMCLMHKSDQYGSILLKQKDKQNDNHVKNFALKIARNTPYQVDEIERALIELIDEKVLHIEGDILYQKRMVKDNDISKKRSKSGKKGGLKTQDFAKAKSQAKDKANSEYENEYENEYEIEINNEKIDIDTNSDFEKVWIMYEKKGNKKTSLQKWNKLSKKNKDLALSHIPMYAKSTPDKRYRKNFETYINQEVWNDEIHSGKNPDMANESILNLIK